MEYDSHPIRNSKNTGKCTCPHVAMPFVLELVLFRLKVILGAGQIEEEKSCEQTQTEMYLHESSHFGAGGEEIDELPLPPSWGREVDEAEYGNFNNQNPEEYNVHGVDHDTVK